MPVRLQEFTWDRARELSREWFALYYTRRGFNDERQLSPVEDVALRKTWSDAMPGLIDRIAAEAVRPVIKEFVARGLCDALIDSLCKRREEPDFKDRNGQYRAAPTGSEKGKITRLILSPHRDLHVFPLHACRLSNGQCLGDAFEVSYTPSLSLLHLCATRRRERADTLLITQNPTADLPFTEMEGASAEAIFHPHVTVLRKQERIKERLVREATAYQVWHYTGHAWFNPFQPLESALILADATIHDPRHPAPVSWLTLRDLFTSLNLHHTVLAILNGCESGMLLPDVADDYVNLPTGFLYAGAPCVICTLWSINDLSSALVMVKFHELWDKGTGLAVATALREATRWLRDEIRTKEQLERDILPPLLAQISDSNARTTCEAVWQKHSAHLPDKYPFASPVYWAPFVCVGWGYEVKPED